MTLKELADQLYRLERGQLPILEMAEMYQELENSGLIRHMPPSYARALAQIKQTFGNALLNPPRSPDHEDQGKFGGT